MAAYSSPITGNVAGISAGGLPPPHAPCHSWLTLPALQYSLVRRVCVVCVWERESCVSDVCTIAVCWFAGVCWVALRFLVILVGLVSLIVCLIDWLGSGLVS